MREMRREIPQDREVIKRVEYPKMMSPELVEKFADGVPAYSESDPTNPEWRSTPEYHWDLRSEGYGEVHIKDESDKKSNPTGTIKDRAAWELATLYRDYGRGLWLQQKAGAKSVADIQHMSVPRLTLFTAGNEGRAVAEVFARYDLPPPKLAIDKSIKENNPDRLAALQKLRSDIYLLDGSIEYAGKDLLRLTDNEDGVDITSAHNIEPQAIFYDWHTHEVFNNKPDRIYVPYGSGRLYENYIYRQQRTLVNDSAGQKDPRLRVGVSEVIRAHVLAAQPQETNSIADKLTADFRPFVIFEDTPTSLHAGSTGGETGVTAVSDNQIKHAQAIYKTYGARDGVAAEPSAAAALALYMENYKAGKVRDEDRVTIVNTGHGLVEE